MTLVRKAKPAFINFILRRMYLRYQLKLFNCSNNSMIEIAKICLFLISLEILGGSMHFENLIKIVRALLCIHIRLQLFNDSVFKDS